MKGSLPVALVLALLVAACGGGASTTVAPTQAPTATPGVTTPSLGGDAVNGEDIYSGTCIACHGTGGVGLEGLGKPFIANTFIAGLSDAELLEFIKEGRDTGHPDNTTGVLMPPLGGNPSLTDADLADVIAYLRILN